MTLDGPEFSSFTDGARKVVTAAHEEAVRVNSEYVGTEHVLIALARDQAGLPANVLKTLGVDAPKIERELAKLVARPTPPIPAEMLPLPIAPRAGQILKLAKEEARNLKHNHIGSEHLLLGLLRDPESVAANILMNLGLALDDASRAVLKLMERVPPQQTVMSREAPGIQPSRAPSLCPPENPESRKRPRHAHDSGWPAWITRLFGGEGKAFEDSPEYKRFTDRARKVMALANREAVRLNQEYVGTEHILLALAVEGAGVAAQVLKTLHIEMRSIHEEVERIVPRGDVLVPEGRLPQTPRTEHLLKFAVDEARNLNHLHVGTEHLLLGLLRETEGVAAQVLVNLGLKLDDVRTAVLSHRDLQ